MPSLLYGQDMKPGTRPASGRSVTMGRRHVARSQTSWLGAMFVALLAFTLALVACQVRPSLPLMSALEDAQDFGYAEQQVAEHRFEVSYLGPVQRTFIDEARRQEDAQEALGQAYDFALWRAAGLTMLKGYAAFSVATTRDDVEVTITYPTYFYPSHHDLLDRRFYYLGHFGYGPFYRSAWLQVRVTLTIDMLAEASADAVDPNATVERMRKKYPDATGLAVPPT